MEQLVTYSPEQTQELGKVLGRLAQGGDVFLLIGNLGAGKTCLTQGIAWGLGVTDYVMSPSFVIVREYRGRLPMYHMDFYRLENIGEIADLGLDEYFYGGGVSVVEWADRAVSLLPEENLTIVMEYIGVNERKFSFQANGDRYGKLVGDLWIVLGKDLDRWSWR
ncbi:MAG: tRNA (adenosine(37)-N6)-threonylcarbamoyltransferase complex ATPase subunit type 1 TsaE [Dehalococcoidia bacterium]|nr:tRNA (adenosine(37)-N6)-threonylcarbamoyltransferase complex ATPase subunit type 1 TsaE [Dehalococcoidia bacterium]